MVQIFISYCHADEQWLNRVRIHLKPLQRDGMIKVWADSDIEPGQEWRESIQHSLELTQIAILLVSADFLASDFITDEEMPRLLEAAKNRGAAIFPIIISPCRYEHTPALSFLQTVNDPRRPLTQMTFTEQEAVFVKLAAAVERALLGPISQFRDEVAKRLERTGEEANNLISKIKSDPTISEEDREIYSIQMQLVIVDRQILALGEELASLERDRKQVWYSLKRDFIERELDSKFAAREFLADRQLKIDHDFRKIMERIWGEH